MNGAGAPPNSGRRDPAPSDQSPLQRAIAALEKMKARLDNVERAGNEPIAIIGMACRFPGGGEGPEAFWHVLDDGIDAVREIPPVRWPPSAIRGGKPEAQWAALLDDISKFDARFFGISPREAESLDPQQRMLLEVSWEATEDAGLAPDSLVGSRTGVFVGICGNDYRFLVTDARAGEYDAYCATGSMLCTAAGRISFFMGFQGPALSIDTGCSASLVAVAQACQSLRANDSDVALAGGVNALLSSTMMAMAAETQALSPDGRCKTLDARANGFVRGEGCGIIVLKRLSDALRDGDRIRGLIRGWAVNQDGRSTGLTAPNVLSQQAMLRQALERSRLAPSDIGYVELHGTGTSLGDPIEAEALRDVFGAPRLDGSVCVLGAAKTNVGHLEGAAGAAGIIKVLLSLQHERIPKNLHFKRLNPRISFDGTPFLIPSQPVPWPRGPKPRRAGVSSFGISGTNAHIVLEEPPVEPIRNDTSSPSCHLLPLSAKTPEALNDLARAYAEWLPSDTSTLQDLVYTASARRTHHGHRLAIIGQTRTEISSALSSMMKGDAPSGVMRGQTLEQGSPKVVFVFPGQGSQWLGMGRQLLATEPAFQRALESCNAAIHNEAEFSILDELVATEDRSRLGEIDVVQPLLFALAVSLAHVWQSWGIEPDCVVGHSMGEVAAAHVAGILTLEDAAKVICRRSRLLKRIRGQGAMALVELPMAEAESTLWGYESALGVAVSNGPRSSVISGDPNALDELVAKLEKEGIFCRRVKVDVASHSPQVDPLRSDLLDALADIRPSTRQIPMRSTVTGTSLQGGELVASYWWHNLRQPVRFSQAIGDLVRSGHRCFIEMSPHPILLPSIEENLHELSQGGVTIACLRRQTDERRVLLEGLGQLYARGHKINWSGLHPAGGRVVSLPRYPWQRENFWIATAVAGRKRNDHQGHPVIGSRIRSSALADARVWQAEWGLDELPYLTDHQIGEQIVVPGTAYIEAALFAAQSIAGSAPVVLEDISFVEPLVVVPETTYLVEVVLKLRTNGDWQYSFSSCVNADKPTDSSSAPSWTTHAVATLRIGGEHQRFSGTSLAEIRRQCVAEVPLETVEQAGRALGLQFGPAFRALTTVWKNETDIVARIALPEVIKSQAAQYLVHPALLDSSMRVLAINSQNENSQVPRALAMIRRLVWWQRAGDVAWSHGKFAQNSRDAMGNVALFDDSAQPLLFIEGIETRPIGRIGTPPDPLAQLFYAQQWQMTAMGRETRNATGHYLILCDDSGVGEQLGAALTTRRATVTLVWAKPSTSDGQPSRKAVDPGSPDEVNALVKDILGAPRPVNHIVDCWGLPNGFVEVITQDVLEAVQIRRCGGALHIVQALLRSGARQLPKLWVITRCTQAIQDEPRDTNIADAPLWGLGRTIALECPELRCTRIDLDEKDDQDQFDAMAAELTAGEDEDEIAFRSRNRYVGRLAKPVLSYEPDKPTPISPDASYLITGGLGGLGLLAAKTLANAGARHLVLMGRRGPTTAAQQREISALEAQGANVHIANANVASLDELTKVLRHVDEAMPPLRGIIHTAGVLEDGALLNQTIERFRRVFEPKMIGAWNLHLLTRHQPLDFFILYSSLSALLGPPGLSNYVAANTFLDALAHYRRKRNLAATSINWGLFADTGMASKAQSAGRVIEHGIVGMTAATYESSLLRTLRERWIQMGLAEINFRAWRDAHPQVASLKRFEILQQSLASAIATPKFRDKSMLEAIEAAHATERLPMLEKLVRTQLGTILRMDPIRIDRLAPLRSLGIDSLMSLELRNRLEAVLGLELSATLVWSHPHVCALAEHLLALMPNKPSVAANPIDPQPPEPKPQDAKIADNDHDLLRAFDQSMQRVRTRRKT